MNRYRAIAWPGYMVASLLLLFPMIDTVLTIFPLRPGDVTWRFGAAGLFSRALMTPLLGLLIVFVVALLLDHRWVLRGVAVLSGVAAVLLIAALGLFVLDTLQMRAGVQPEVVRSLDVASLTAIAKYGAVAVTLLTLAFSGWRNSRKDRHKNREAGEADLLLRGRAARPVRGHP